MEKALSKTCVSIFFMALALALAIPAQAANVKTVTAVDPKTKKKIKLRGNFQLRKSDSTSSTSYGNVASHNSTIELTGKRNKSGDWLEVKVSGMRRWIKIDSVVNKSALRPVAMTSAPLPPKRPSELSVVPTVPLPPKRPGEFAATQGTGTETPAVEGASTTTPAQPPARPGGRRLAPRTAARMETGAKPESKSNPAADAPVAAAPSVAAAPASATTSALPANTTSTAASTGESLVTSAARARAAVAPKVEKKEVVQAPPASEPPKNENKNESAQKPTEPDCIKDSTEYQKNSRFQAAMPDPYQSKWSGGGGQIELYPDGRGQLEVALGIFAKPAVKTLYASGKIPGPMKGEGDREPYPMEVCLREGQNPYVIIMGSQFDMNDPKGTSFDSKLGSMGTKIERVVK